jgi:hypothetical protein
VLSPVRLRWSSEFAFEWRHYYNCGQDCRHPIVDPYPEMNLEYALKLLRIRFGNEKVQYAPDSRQITIPIEYPGAKRPVSVTLTAEQAKYLAVNSIDLRDIVEGRSSK